ARRRIHGEGSRGTAAAEAHACTAPPGQHRADRAFQRSEVEAGGRRDRDDPEQRRVAGGLGRRPAAPSAERGAGLRLSAGGTSAGAGAGPGEPRGEARRHRGGYRRRATSSSDLGTGSGGGASSGPQANLAREPVGRVEGALPATGDDQDLLGQQASRESLG